MNKPEKKLAPEREKKPVSRRKMRPTPKEKVLLGKLSEQERKAQETYKRCVERSEVEHQIRVNAANNAGSRAVRTAKAVFDTEAKKLSATLKKSVAVAEKEYAKGMELLRESKGAITSAAEKALDSATQASSRQHETEEAALTNGLNESLSIIFAERESIEYGDKAGKGKGS